MNKLNLQKPLFKTTLGDFKMLFDEILHEASSQKTIVSEPTKTQFVYGTKGLSELLGCSESTASRIMRKGTLNSATRRIGKIIMFELSRFLIYLKLTKNEEKI